MKKLLALTTISLIVTGCASTGPATAWAKAGVSRIDYGTDLGMCTGYASMAGAGNGANQAGGISGQNSGAMGTSTEDQQRAGAGAAGQPPPTSGPRNNAGAPGSGTAFPTGGGAYRDSASSDMVQRAATQQRTQEMAKQRARQLTLSNCLTERGYTEIKLTPAQRAELGTLQHGSKEYHEYLYKLGADPEVIKAQSATRAGS